MTPIYTLYEALFSIKRSIRERKSYDPHIFIFVAWGSATGKTSRVAKNIQKFFPGESIILSMDNYFKGQKYFDEHGISFDEPDAVDIDLFAEHLQRLKKWEVVSIPDYDFKTAVCTYDAIEVHPQQIIIIEWLFALDKRFQSLTDLNLFVETSENGRLIRRVLRDTERTGQSPEEIIDYFMNTLKPLHDAYIEPQKSHADMIILNEFNKELEARYKDTSWILENTLKL